MFLTPARASSTTIQMAKSTTVSTMVVCPAPNTTMMTGTSADSGAERNMLTQGRKMRSARIERPMSTPSGTPMPMAMILPRMKALPVIHRASPKAAVGTISMMRAKIRDSGGMMKLAPVRPAISQTMAQISSDDMMGRRNFPMVMVLSLNPDSA